MKKTKIVATIGPATKEESVLKELINDGMDVARINLTHADHHFSTEIIEKIKRLNIQLNRNVAVMLDMQGPDIRIEEIAGGTAKLAKGDKIRIYKNEVLGDRTKFSLNDKELVDEILVGAKIFIDDGKVELEVVAKGVGYLICEVKNEGFVGTKKSVNVCGSGRTRPFLNKKDIADIEYASKTGADFLAVSFVNTSQDMLEVNDLLISLGNDDIEVIAKIETEKAVQDIDAIMNECDGIMVARGDLGIEMAIEKLPGIQKKLIQKCIEKGKYGIVATEMLASMEHNPRPTRAEVSDVANAVIDGVDAVMLSSETAVGEYPILAVHTMTRIIKIAEQNINYIELLNKALRHENCSSVDLIAYSVADCANRLNAKAIMVTTMSGTTARKMSRLRPSSPIFALSPSERTVKSLALHFGIIPILVKELQSFDKITQTALMVANDKLKLVAGDKLLITGGYPFKENSPTNFMKIEEI